MNKKHEESSEMIEELIWNTFSQKNHSTKPEWKTKWHKKNNWSLEIAAHEFEPKGGKLAKKNQR